MKEVKKFIKGNKLIFSFFSNISMAISASYIFYCITFLIPEYYKRKVLVEQMFYYVNQIEYTWKSILKELIDLNKEAKKIDIFNIDKGFLTDEKMSLINLESTTKIGIEKIKDVGYIYYTKRSLINNRNEYILKNLEEINKINCFDIKLLELIRKIMNSNYSKIAQIIMKSNDLEVKEVDCYNENIKEFITEYKSIKKYYS